LLLHVLAAGGEGLGQSDGDALPVAGDRAALDGGAVEDDGYRVSELIDVGAEKLPVKV
jgi:hypothetical protein